MGTSVVVGDLTACRVDAIVNAANAHLLPGGGVCGAIHGAGGPQIEQECRRVVAEQYPQGLPVGQAVATTGGRLPARFVIHAVGPVYGVDPDEALGEAYRNSLRVARELGCQTIAFPAISTGIYGFPAELAAPIVQRVLDECAGDIDVQLVFFDRLGRDVFEAHRFDR